MIRLEQALLDELAQGRKLALATIVSLAGSAPRTPGTRMAVREDGSIIGTIGGGRLEAEVMAAGREAAASGRGRLMRFSLVGKDVKDMDMICGGVLDVLVEPLWPSAATQAFLARVARAALEGSAMLVTWLRPAADDDPDALDTAHALLERGPHDWAYAAGHEQAAQAALSRAEEVAAERCPVLVDLVEAEGMRLVMEPLRSAGGLYLFGAGHVSQQVAKLAALVDFRIIVLDDRADFANRERFPEADQVLVPEDFTTAMADLSIDADTSLVIVSRGHRYDMDLLEQALATSAGYIGMIGSRRKRDTIYAALRDRGFGDADFARVHCPIGLAIGAETPEEIGLAIVAELVQARARRHDRLAE